MLSLAGKVAIVTGASQGIGRAAMRMLAGEGAYVFALARDSENLNDARSSVPTEFRTRVTAIPTDVRDEAAVRQAVGQAASAFGRLDIVVNAAGVSMRGKQHVQEIDLAEWNRIMDTNLTGTFLMSKEALQYMTAKNSGYIVNILSTAAFQASGGDSLYAASKFGARALTESLISAQRGSRIKVTSISPGPVDTNIWSHKTKPVTREKRDSMLKAEDIADIVLFLITRPPHVHIDNITVTPWTVVDNKGRERKPEKKEGN